MPADTLNEMILGFAVIFGVLISYAVSLMIRTRQAKGKHHTQQDK